MDRKNKHNHIINYQYVMLVFFLLFMLPAIHTEASEQTPLGPLIQTTTQEEEYEALVHLELLKTPLNDNGDLSQSIRNVLPSIVQIRSGIYWGSGTILKIKENSILVVSNRHLLSHQNIAYVKFYNGKEAAGRVLAVSNQVDVAFAEVDISDWSYEYRRKLREVCSLEKDRTVKGGDAMFLVGSTDGVACNIYEGEVRDPWYFFEEFDSYMIYNDCKAKAGMSGGGTFDAQGRFIGMITGGHDEETASLPMNLIREESERLIGFSP